MRYDMIVDPRRLRALIAKEWQEALKNKMVLFGVLFLPLFFLGFSVYMLMRFGEEAGEIGQAVILNQMLMYFLLMPMIIPLAIAVYAIVGEKDQQSLEPLLATPITDLELFLGKALASVVPALLITWVSFGVFLAIAAYLVPWHILGPTLSAPWLLSIFGLAPLIATFSVTATMAISSRTRDTRAAYQTSSFVMLPLLIPMIIYTTRGALVSTAFVAAEGAILILLDVGMLYLGIRLFRREEILTRWR